MKICCFPREGSDRFCHELLASACCVFSSPPHDGTSPFLIHLLGASHFAPFTQPRFSWPLAPAWACSSQVIGCFWASDTPGVTGRRQKGQSVSCLPQEVVALGQHPATSARTLGCNTAFPQGPNLCPHPNTPGAVFSTAGWPQRAAPWGWGMGPFLGSHPNLEPPASPGPKLSVCCQLLSEASSIPAVPAALKCVMKADALENLTGIGKTEEIHSKTSDQ